MSHSTHDLIRLLAAGSLGLLLTGCVFLPREANDDHPQCNMVTGSYTLEASPVGHVDLSGNDPRAIVAILALVPAGSLIVSGSIVAVNDTVHWIEYQGRCSDSETHRASTALVNSAQVAGGHVLKTSADVVAWIKRYSPGTVGSPAQ